MSIRPLAVSISIRWTTNVMFWSQLIEIILLKPLLGRTSAKRAWSSDWGGHAEPILCSAGQDETWRVAGSNQFWIVYVVHLPPDHFLLIQTEADHCKQRGKLALSARVL